ncbi:MAG: T9SS type A sorting domain-containing protein, partial [Ignavibacteriaceae bacterium]|nr:T9SS type A sorting domain-containing protein [Ignavibacteriaceae bacterium]
GNYKYEWIAENLPSGIYFYKMKADSYEQTKKLVLLK